jgi:hypothetical protein
LTAVKQTGNCLGSDNFTKVGGVQSVKCEIIIKNRQNSINLHDVEALCVIYAKTILNFFFYAKTILNFLKHLKYSFVYISLQIIFISFQYNRQQNIKQLKEDLKHTFVAVNKIHFKFFLTT